jgi:predicted nucleic acid-binding protein
MVIVSDTNILSSLAAADALLLLSQIFPNDTIHIPPAVEQELQAALAFGKQHIDRIFVAIQIGAFHRIELTVTERLRMATLPSRLNAGEREGIVLCQARKLLFLCNDRRAIRYCEANAIEVAALTTILRLL